MFYQVDQKKMEFYKTFKKGLKLRFSRLTNLIVLSPSPQKTALTLTLGFYLSLFPVIGSTALLCLIASLLFRLNPLFIQAVNMLLFPVQIALMYPFAKVGQILFYGRSDFSSVSLKQLISADGYNTFIYLLNSLVGAILMWAVFSMMTGVFLYRLFFNFYENHSSNTQHFEF